MITRVFSQTRSVEISPEGPTVLIGERISPSARKGLGEALVCWRLLDGPQRGS